MTMDELRTNYQPQLLSQISSIKQLSLFRHYHLPLPLAEALYFGLTTLTTVGFGDITPITVQGRFVVAFSILAGVAVFPYQFSRLAEVQLSTWSIFPETSWKNIPHFISSRKSGGLTLGFKLPLFLWKNDGNQKPCSLSKSMTYL